MPGYRLVRREDVELAEALPGRSSGLTSCRLVGGTLGSTHMALTLVSLVDGHVDTHLHSFETSFYVLEGEPVLYLDGRGVELEPGACGACPSESRTRFAATAAGSGSRWPRRGRAPTAATRSSSGLRRTLPPSRSTPATRGTATSSCSRTARRTSTA